MLLGLLRNLGIFDMPTATADPPAATPATTVAAPPAVLWLAPLPPPDQQPARDEQLWGRDLASRAAGVLPAQHVHDSRVVRFGMHDASVVLRKPDDPGRPARVAALAGDPDATLAAARDLPAVVAYVEVAGKSRALAADAADRLSAASAAVKALEDERSAIEENTTPTPDLIPQLLALDGNLYRARAALADAELAAKSVAGVKVMTERARTAATAAARDALRAAAVARLAAVEARYAVLVEAVITALSPLLSELLDVTTAMRVIKEAGGDHVEGVVRQWAGEPVADRNVRVVTGGR